MQFASGAIIMLRLGHCIWGEKMAKHLKVSLKRFHAIEVTRIAIGNQKLVYVLIANRKFHYTNGKSSVAYIGTTKKGIRRVASGPTLSLASRLR